MSPRKKPDANINTDEMLNFMAEYGRAYLSSGGPTSRLEEDLALLGLKLGFPTEIFATPTGIFVSCTDQNGANHTALSRIKDGSINLEKLCWLEQIFADMIEQKISISQAARILNSRRVHRPPYTLFQTLIAAFIAGFALSYPAFSMFGPALACGAISMVTFWISGPGLKDQITSSIFRDFMGCVVTLGLAGVCQFLVPAPFEAYTIGGLVVLVPGLALTTAISELADQNLVSGTSKLMQAILTLLALGLAYMLFQDLSDAMQLMPAPSSGPRPLSALGSALGLLTSVTCFGVLFKVPKKSLIWSSLTGFLGWIVLRQIGSSQFIVASSFVASLVVGVTSLILGYRFKVPSQVFSVPGIIAMLPGMLALTSLRSLAVGQQSSGLELGVRVAMTAGAIVFGLFTARIPFALISNSSSKAKAQAQP